MLDQAAPNNPVLLHDNSNHLLWVNSAALKAAGITKDTPDPAGGKILRDSSGNPTGALTEKAAVLVTKHVPAPPQAQIEEAAKWIFDRLNTFGVTAIQTAQADAGRVKAYRDLERKGKLTVRLKLRWDWNTRYAPVGLDEMAARFATRAQRGPRTALIDPDGVKIYTDGVPNGHGSPFIEAYSDGDGTNYGSIYLNQPQLSAALTKFDAAGLSVMLHAVGDQAVHNTLNAIQAAREVNGNGGPRHHISHNFMVHADDVGRAAKMNVSQEASPIDVLFPGDMTMSYATELGRERVNRSMPAKTIIDAGGHLSYGSDWDNVPDPDPWFTLQAMITRRNPDAPMLGQTSPHQAVDLVTGLEMLTYNGAYGMGLETVTGSIEVGKDADLIVLSQNLFEIPVNKIRETKVLRTVLMGKTVHQAGSAPTSGN
jgi:hypothetical protein